MLFSVVCLLQIEPVRKRIDGECQCLLDMDRIGDSLHEMHLEVIEDWNKFVKNMVEQFCVAIPNIINKELQLEVVEKEDKSDLQRLREEIEALKKRLNMANRKRSDSKNRVLSIIDVIPHGKTIQKVYDLIWRNLKGIFFQRETDPLRRSVARRLSYEEQRFKYITNTSGS